MITTLTIEASLNKTLTPEQRTKKIGRLAERWCCAGSKAARDLALAQLRLLDPAWGQSAEDAEQALHAIKTGQFSEALEMDVASNEELD